eukprot:PhF_6_TR25323/c0_g2_i2/m.34988
MNTVSRVAALYAKYAPDKLGNIDAAMKAYAGREQELIDALIAKYGPEPTSSGSMKDRVIVMYAKYSQEKIGNVDAAMQAYAGREQELIDALVAKYGPEPSGDMRSRVLAMYQKYAPDKVGNVDAAMKAYAGREQELIEALVAKYGPEPASSPRAASVAPTSNGTLRARVLAMYQKYAPEKAGNVDAAMQAYAGREQELIDALVAKYGPEPGATSAGDKSDMRSRVLSMYQAYAPEKAGNVDAAMQAYAGREQELIDALVAKYGPEPGETSADQSDMKSRVLAMYQKYAPDKVGNVDAAMKAYAGREQELIEALVNKYGAEPVAAAPTQSAQPAQPAQQDYASRVRAMYQKYAPDKVGNVQAA